MSELGIFIDESGVFEINNLKNDKLKDFYIVSFLFHDKSVKIDIPLKDLETKLNENDFNFHTPIHTMPLIRQQKPYLELDGNNRRKLFYILFQFMRKLNIKHKTFIYDKSYCNSKQTIKQNLESYIRQMITANFNYFNKFDEIVIYYDEGQNYLTKILNNTFSKNLSNYRFKNDAFPDKYRLLQCADMVCTLELIKQRKQNNEYIKAIEKFFINGNKLNKNYLKPYNDLEL